MPGQPRNLMATPREKIGQMIMIGLGGTELSPEEQSLLRDYPFGGFILFAHNLKEPNQILSLCRSLWEIKRDPPPFIAIDQEGGRVHRLPPPFIQFPPAAMLGRTRNCDLAYQAGLATAHELSAVGINLNFAPVLDVLSNPRNPVIGDRSFGSEPQLVTTLGWAVIVGLRNGGVIPCGKHFPGHGDTLKDSHLELPSVKKRLAQLNATELPPFIYACRNQVESLMTAHVVYPALDPDYPATLSTSIIGKRLRQAVGYRGVVFGDDMEMKAISQNYSLEDTVTLAVRAGVDVFLFCHDRTRAVGAFDILLQRAEKNAQTRARIEESYRRIQRLKQRYLKSFKGMGEDLRTQHIGITGHQKLADEIIKAGEH